MDSAHSTPPRLVQPSTWLAESRRVLGCYGDEPGDAAVWQSVVELRRAVATAIGALPSMQKSGPEVEASLALLKLFAQSGVGDQPAANEDIALADACAKCSWPGLLAAMLLVPAWQWPAAPRLDDVPAWLWSDYTEYLFRGPDGFSRAGQAAIFAAHTLSRLEELARWAGQNRGSAAVRSALMVYLTKGNCIPLYFNDSSLRRHFEQRARVLALGNGVGVQEEITAFARQGRRLRIGFVSRHFGSQTETYTTLPTFEQLDPERFEVLLFAHHDTGSPLEDYARSRATSFQLLSGDLAAQVDALRAATLDVVVFGTNVTAVCNEVTQLALHRVAPLQMVNNSSCTTSGMPEVDLYVSGDLTESVEAPAHFTERLALLPGPAHAFNYEADRQEPTSPCSRASLQIPEDAVVFVTAANYFKIVPEMQAAWAKVLVAVPGSRLLVHPFNPNWVSSYPIKRFCSEFDRVLREHGVAIDRLVVSTTRFPSRTDVKELLRVGDIYLDSYPFGGVNSLVDPLEVGLPVIAWEGTTFRSRMGAALLRSLGLPELIVQDAEAYGLLAIKLAIDPTWRHELRTKIQGRMERTPVFLDPLAASEAFGALAEAAYDELAEVGREAFRAERKPFRVPLVADAAAELACAAEMFGVGRIDEAATALRRLLAVQPASPSVRHLMGRVLLAQDRAARAAEYLLAVTPHVDTDAPLWHDLAVAFSRSGRPNEALQALEVSLRIDGSRVDGWLMLGDLALERDNQDFLKEVVTILQGLAPDDPRVSRLASQHIGANAPSLAYF